jgi:EPS-associated MarR family transcriptional regulator
MTHKPVSSRHIAAQEDIQFRIMRLLEASLNVSQRELAAHLGISLGPLSFWLKGFIEKGLVRLEIFHESKYKLKCTYILAPSGIAQKITLAGRFLKQKIEEYAAIKAEIESMRVDLADSKTSLFLNQLPDS